VHVLVPGFSVQELPVRLSNINNLRFAPDGRLTALGYDGRVHLLRDSDGDGLEDRDELFWDKSTLSVPVGMCWAPEGLYVSAHGKVSLLRDPDADGKADTEEIIATNWPPTDVGSGGVDATAVTRDREGNLYFGLLVADYSNAYRLRKRKDLTPEEQARLLAHGDKGGNAEETLSLYDVTSRRGTIQKWNVKTKKLDTIATGIRVPYTLAFNRLGDLFVTDQEGETWMPNGNPLDELNHIIPGRNYGFPPRHEKWLPNLISEPPVVAFGPQHESTCGLVFNEPHGPVGTRSTASQKSLVKKNVRDGVESVPTGMTYSGQGLFGPKWWEGDAFVAGESRGKIWRVRLVKTPNGYVGKEYLIARLSMLTTDVAISPHGDLYVSCHSGLPDWGTGPNGEGKIFKISYTDTNAPQPVALWAANPMEVRVAFDRPIDFSVTNYLDQIKIEFGEFVRVAGRFEVLKPPYQVVNFQEATPRGTLRVLSARLSSDQRTLMLNTDPHPQSVTYALTLPGIRTKGSNVPAAAVDLDYDLNGVEASWRGANSSAAAGWDRGWLPHIDSEVNRLFSEGSSEHGRWLHQARQLGTLRLSTQINLPAGQMHLRLEANAPFQLRTGANSVNASASASGNYAAQSTVPSDGQPVPLEVTLETRVTNTALHASYSSDIDPTWRPMPFEFFKLPWAPPHQPLRLPEGKAPELAGGDYERGRESFFGEKLKCATCHRLRGEGATIGPDLSNVVHRDAASVLRDIKEPSAAIHPDYVAFNIALRDGEQLNGFVRGQDEHDLRIIGADGKEVMIARDQVKQMQPGSVSLMPSGLIDGLADGQIRDLLTFLLSVPPTRTRAEIEQILGAAASSTGSLTFKADEKSRNDPGAAVEHVPPRLRIVLVASKQDHGPGQHDYPAWQTNWYRLLNQAENVTVTEAWLWPSREQFHDASVIVFYYWNHDWNAEQLQQIDEFLGRGGGLVLFHSATIADQEPEQLAQRIGLAAQPQRTKYLHCPFDLDFVAPTNHPITRGLPLKIHLVDEPYWPLIGDTNKVQVLATTEQEGKAWPMLWTFEKNGGRVFASIAGHYTWTLDDPLFRLLALRGMAWAAKTDASRFESLIR
jgi:putative heme-binding domain-containing protein